MSAKAQARGLVVSRMAGRACSNTRPAMLCSAGVFERPKHGAQRPQRAAMAVVRTALFQPVALVIHEVAEAPGLGVEGIPDEGEIAGSQFERLAVAQCLQERAHHQGAGVVVGRVALAVVGHGENGVLQHAGLVRHVAEMIEFERRQFARMFDPAL